MIMDFDRTLVSGRNEEILREVGARRLEGRLREHRGRLSGPQRLLEISVRNLRLVFLGEDAPTGRATSAS